MPDLPRVLHWIWLGPSPVPPAHEAWMAGWRERHPQWRARVWREQDLPPLANEEAYRSCRSWAQKADVARYEILLAHGGVYVDTDVECVRSIEPLCAGATAFVAEERPGLLGNAVLAAAPGHPWMRAVVDGLAGSFREHGLTLDQTGPGFLTRLTRGRGDVVVHPAVTFYPYPSTAASPADPSPDTYAVHHWAKSWQPSEVEHVRAGAEPLVARLVRPGDRLVVVGEGIELTLPAGCHAAPFVERDGQDWGPPADDEQALAELARHRADGVRWIVVLAPALWWLEHYTGLHRVLRETALETVEDYSASAFRIG